MVRGVRAALADMLGEASLGGARPSVIARQLGIDKTLAWKVSRFVQAPDPLKAFRHMPGSDGVEIVVRAAESQGVGNKQADAVRHADRQLREFMLVHAGDRRAFEAMLAGGDQSGQLEFEERRAYFRAGSVVWGARAKVQMLTLVLRPSETVDGKLDVLHISGLIGLERLRADTPRIVRRLRASNDSEGQTFVINRVPLDPKGVSGGSLALLPEYCSEPTPEIRQFKGADGWLYDEIAPGEVGRRGAVTCVMGEIHPAVLPFRRSEENTAGRYSLPIRTPVERVQFDLLIHEDLSHFGPAAVKMFGLLEERPHAGGAAPSAIPLYEPAMAQLLGSPPVMQTPSMENYTRLFDDAFARAGWGELAAFRGYRTEMEYPPFPCDITMVCEIGESAE